MGVAASVLSQTYPPKSKFHPDQVPDLTGKVILVTGGSAGELSERALGVVHRCGCRLTDAPRFCLRYRKGHDSGEQEHVARERSDLP